MNGAVFPVPADKAEEIREAVQGSIELCERAIAADPKKRKVDAELLMPFLNLVREVFDDDE